MSDTSDHLCLECGIKTPSSELDLWDGKCYDYANPHNNTTRQKVNFYQTLGVCSLCEAEVQTDQYGNHLRTVHKKRITHLPKPLESYFTLSVRQTQPIKDDYYGYSEGFFYSQRRIWDEKKRRMQLDGIEVSADAVFTLSFLL